MPSNYRVITGRQTNRSEPFTVYAINSTQLIGKQMNTKPTTSVVNSGVINSDEANRDEV